MDIAEAKSLTARRPKRKRVGRGHGSGHGKTCGRGRDGARSRSGWSQRNMTGGNIPLWRRLPKRGFTNAPFKKEYTTVNVERLACFPAETLVTPELLEQQGMIKQVCAGGVKVLGNGELDRPLTVRVHALSRSAREKIEAAGGRVELIPGPSKPVRNKMRPRPAKTPEGEA